MKTKRLIFGICLIALSSTYYALPKSAAHHPVSEYVIEREVYSLAYDGRLRQARWVHEYLTAENLKGGSERGQCDFREDPLIPSHLRSIKSDYAGSGYDRGHLCPAADAHSSDKAMQETFYLSNVSPQIPQFNRGYWAKLEKYVRTLTEQQGIHVFTGGLYLPHEASDGKKYVKYRVIGENDVAVPTHFFKVVLDEQRMPIAAYILPNQPIQADTPLEKFQVAVEQVEKAAGLVFAR